MDKKKSIRNILVMAMVLLSPHCVYSQVTEHEMCLAVDILKGKDNAQTKAWAVSPLSPPPPLQVEARNVLFYATPVMFFQSAFCCKRCKNLPNAAKSKDKLQFLKVMSKYFVYLCDENHSVLVP